MSLDLRWSTDIVTFFNPEYWDMPAEQAYSEWERKVDEDPHRFFDKMLDGAAEAQLSGIELAPAPGGWVNALRAYGTATAFKKELDRRGLVLSSSYVLPTALKAVVDAPDAKSRAVALNRLHEETAQHAEFLREVGCQTLITSTVPRAEFSETAGVEASADSFAKPADPDLMGSIADVLEGAGKIASESGVHLAIHTDAYSLASRVEDIDTLMSITDPNLVKLCIDAGHIALDGSDAVSVVRKHALRAPILHWKDCAAHLPPHKLSGTPMERHDVMIKSFRVMGEKGIVDWRKWTMTLKEQQWSGWGVAEIDMSVDPIREIRDGIEYYDSELSQN
ncbi:sugar phosphate isomerase/epimerase [Glutamicibacter sp. M10]|uniref:sugar phosphate isomerase/epimerase family protein n=1 Tax=Glutamicibacter sp. M10 TaxID=3023076 RepID=UPI0021C57F39|nr:sugar phosphate isomerase/epimerase [Glutamicibacter sp. M10]UXN32884.1 sugar phosphate isomerase/epimerase [Glutamicibacter sp. M10]